MGHFVKNWGTITCDFQLIPEHYFSNKTFNLMLDQPMRTSPPKTYLAESILVTLFCCLPFGIVGIVHAAKVESAFNSGDQDGAERASSEAKKWTMIGFWIGIVGLSLYLIVLAGMFFFVAKNGGLDPQEF